jgi:tetratricopeptide (TPR) repeat protein
LLVHLVEQGTLSGRWEPVLAALERLERLQPDPDGPTRELLDYHRGLAFLELGRPEDAVTSLRRLVDAMPRSARYRLLLADSLIRLEDWSAARTHLRAGLAAEPGDPACLCALGWAFYQAGDRRGGRDALREALTLHPEYYPAHVDLGLLFAAEGRWADSEAHLAAALAWCPGDHELRDMLAAARQGRLESDAARRRGRELGRSLRPRRRALTAGERALVGCLRRELRQLGADPLETLLAERLWLDFSQAARPRPRLDAAWLAAVVVAACRMNGREVSAARVARAWGVAASTVRRRAERICRELGARERDIRYCARPGEPEAACEEEAQADPAPPPRAAGTLIPVDFVARTRLPEGTPTAEP